MMSRRLRIRGTVQGVGYRYALRREALKLGVTGWVRNRADGSVEALVQGGTREIDAITAWVRTGPPAARVTEVVIEPAEAAEARPHKGFDLLPTV